MRLGFLARWGGVMSLGPAAGRRVAAVPWLPTPPTRASSSQTQPRICSAWLESSSEAEAASSAPAAFDWVTRSICEAAVVTWPIPLVCSLLAAAISDPERERR
jgi:hypothetical protein